MREEERRAVDIIAAEEEGMIPSDDDDDDEEDEHITRIAGCTSTHSALPYASSYQSPARSGTRRAAGSASTPNTRSPTKKREKRNADVEVI